ncbi:MAG: ABC transporter permease [Eubacteriales bacterium]|nr:ABC transporter permease [Eubacteriales bacterium]
MGKNLEQQKLLEQQQSDLGAQPDLRAQDQVNFRRSKPPLIHIVKRDPPSQLKAILVYLAAIFASLLLGALLVWALGHNPFSVYRQIITGSLASATALKETVKMAIPLLICGIAVAIAFKMKFWNIGAEGQILIGGFASMIIPIYLPQLPLLIKLVLMALLAFFFAGLFGLIPAFFKVRWGTNETLFTLMLNYIALQWVRFLQYRKSWQDPGTRFPKIRPLSDAEVLPKLFGVHIGWLFALILVVLAWFYLKRSKHGFEIAIIGDSIQTARYVGMNVPGVILRTIFISAGIAGLVGFFQVAGADSALTDGTAGGVGFTAITVAWLAKLNPFVMVLVSLGLAILQKGSISIQSTMGIPASAANLLSGLILFAVLGSEFFLHYKLHSQKRGPQRFKLGGRSELKAEGEHQPYRKESK